ncbi:hypothetical protein [Amycolatopsis sp. cmx-4-68]|uniref:hypothetical protein n=1 Tax=Amycolatopsis sp. cmx-4-68 TaxID=2790938 RepID=UPI00397D32EA
MNKQVLVAALIVMIAVTAGGVAFAYWRGTGHGNSSGTTGTAAPLTLSPATPSAALYPGGTTSVALTAANPNASSARIGSLALDTSQGIGGFAVDAGHSGCGTSTLNFATQTSDTGWTVPAKVGATNGVLPITVPDALAMGPTAANACQGASITIYLVVGS